MELLPCPFCGSKDLAIMSDDASIWCNKCSGGVQNYNISEVKLIKEWNTRTPPIENEDK